MEDLSSQVFFPASFNELFAAWNKYPDAKLFAGGTGIIWRQGKNIPDLPPEIICLDKLEELSNITRTEKYLEIGAMVTLNRLLWLGKAVPEVLCRCIENIAGIQVRNIATIGGNICCTTRLLDTAAPMTALDAQYELRSANSSRWISASRFYLAGGRNVLEKGEFLTRIRVPLEPWDYSVYSKFSPDDIYNSEVLVFLAKTQKNILTGLKVVFKANNILQNKKSESIIAGKNLPLSRKTAGDFVDNWISFIAERADMNELLKNEIINCIELSISSLSE